MKATVSLILLLLLARGGPFAAPNYTIEVIRYGTIPQFPVSGLVAGAPAGERIDIPLMFWLIRGEGRNVLLDAGFYRPGWREKYKVADYIRPDEAVRLSGVDPGQIQDLILSHVHWDHADGADLFPSATVWIQKEEFVYYTSAAWQEGGRHGGIEPEDLIYLMRRNVEGRLRLIDGDDREILPGIRVYLGGRHTFASQYVRVDGNPPWVLASDNCYLYRNLEQRVPIPTFEPGDRDSNLRALDRMLRLAGAPDRVIPGHDPLVFTRFVTKGRIARVR